MVRMTMKTTRSFQRLKSTAEPGQRAMSIARFSEDYAIGRTKAYEELRSGRLRGRKIGKRTIISQDDAEAWLRRLPAMPVAKDHDMTAAKSPGAVAALGASVNDRLGRQVTCGR